ncbi:TonB C-terminal domain-containing protein [Pleurocapsales cyanobacterium LEGE 10410]|nr:TonB C-terminal domain-containing protein [Pleurocapsales cyanobacterium LEGE 10410]
MVNSKPVIPSDQETPITNQRGFRRQKLLLFIIASVLVHSLGLLVFDLYQRFYPSSQDEIDSKPIEFVVVPEEPREPPPETQKRAAENSVAENNSEPEKTTTAEELDDEIAPEPTSTPPAEPATAPKIASPPQPQPEPIPAEPTPAPQPAPQPEPEPTSQPTPEPVQDSSPVLSGSDSVSTPESTPQPAEPESLATRLPPQEPLEVPQSTPAPAPTAPAEENSASSLLGGNYKRTLADDGADAFFSPEALAYRDVLNPSQLDALKDIDLGAYFAEVKRRVKRNWSPSYRAEEYTTFLTFNIQKNGQITGLRVTQSSGSEQVDRETIEAIQNSAPFAPLPGNFPLEALEVKFSFNIYIY